MRFIATQFTEEDGWGTVGDWFIVKEGDPDRDPLFGDCQPRDKKEAEQCARAANLARDDHCEQMMDTLRGAVEKILKEY